MNKRYLITAMGGDIGDSVVCCLNREYGKSHLAGCDITPFVPGYDQVENFFLVPPFVEEDRYIKSILEKCAQYKITHVLPMTEGEIKVFDRKREVFSQAGIGLMIHNSRILDVALSKCKTAKAVEKMGLYSPKTWSRNVDFTELRYPVMVKPDCGCGSTGVCVAGNVRECQDAVSSIQDAVIQEYVGTSHDEYTVGIFSSGKTVVSIAFRRTLQHGMSRVVEYVKDEKIQEIAKTVADYFVLKGSLNIQMRKQNGEYYIFDINPRISSTVGFRYEMGFKDLIWWLELMDHDETDISYIPEELPVIGIRTYREKLFRTRFPDAEL